MEPPMSIGVAKGDYTTSTERPDSFVFASSQENLELSSTITMFYGFR
jgi:hypothetical protein